MNKICDLFDFKQLKSSMYHAAANGLAEAFNKTLCNLLKKVVFKSKRDWNKEWKKLCGHIGQHIAHQLKQHHIHLLLELKQSYHSSVKYPP